MNTENNKLIAEFMGYRMNEKSENDYAKTFLIDTKGKRFVQLSALKYHTNWNWLMPVVEKIESIHSEHHGYFGVHISSNSCTVQGTKFRSDKIDINNPVYVNDAYGENKLLATYNAVVQFIQWYNQTPQP